MLELAEGGGQRQPGQSLQGRDARGQPLDHRQELLDKRVNLLQGAAQRWSQFKMPPSQ